MPRDPHKIVRDWKGRFSRVASHRNTTNTKDLKVAIKERRTAVAQAAKDSRKRPSKPSTPKQVSKPTTPKATPRRKDHTVDVKQDLRIGMRPDGTMDYDVRKAYVDPRLDELRAISEKRPVDKNNPGDTFNRYFDDETQTWDSAREKMHEEIVEEYWQTRAMHVPNEGLGLFSGGLGGAGKGYTLRNEFGIDDENDPNFLTVNPDIIKEIMAKRGMVDEDFDPNLTPMERSSVVHEEASYLAGVIANRAYKEKKNLIWDLTMASEGSINKRIKAMRENGYEHIEAVFVDVDVERSVVQATKRWRNGMDKYIEGKNKIGGRYLPSSATEHNHPSKGSPYKSKNREVFEAIKGNFDGTTMFSPPEGTKPDQQATNILVATTGTLKIGKKK